MNINYYEKLAEKITPFKRTERSEHKMLGVIEELMEQVRRETAEKTALESAMNFAKNSIKRGKMTLEEIAEVFNLPLEKVQALAATIK